MASYLFPLDSRDGLHDAGVGELPEGKMEATKQEPGHLSSRTFSESDTVHGVGFLGLLRVYL